VTRAGLAGSLTTFSGQDFSRRVANSKRTCRAETLGCARYLEHPGSGGGVGQRIFRVRVSHRKIERIATLDQIPRAGVRNYLWPASHRVTLLWCRWFSAIPTFTPLI
jgi:hypothetical protein